MGEQWDNLDPWAIADYSPEQQAVFGTTARNALNNYYGANTGANTGFEAEPIPTGWPQQTASPVGLGSNYSYGQGTENRPFTNLSDSGTWGMSAESSKALPENLSPGLAEAIKAAQGQVKTGASPYFQYQNPESFQKYQDILDRSAAQRLSDASMQKGIDWTLGESQRRSDRITSEGRQDELLREQRRYGGMLGGGYGGGAARTQSGGGQGGGMLAGAGTATNPASNPDYWKKRMELMNEYNAGNVLPVLKTALTKEDIAKNTDLSGVNMIRRMIPSLYSSLGSAPLAVQLQKIRTGTPAVANAMTGEYSTARNAGANLALRNLSGENEQIMANYGLGRQQAAEIAKLKSQALNELGIGGYNAVFG